jgi:hypothetical protein
MTGSCRARIPLALPARTALREGCRTVVAGRWSPSCREARLVHQQWPLFGAPVLHRAGDRVPRRHGDAPASSRPAFPMRSTRARGGASPTRPSSSIPTSKRGTIEVRAVEIDSNTGQPLPIALDPVAELEPATSARWCRGAAASWPSARRTPSARLLHTSSLIAAGSASCGLRSDGTLSNSRMRFESPARNPGQCAAVLRLPPATRMVLVELTYRDDSVWKPRPPPLIPLNHRWPWRAPSSGSARARRAAARTARRLAT